MLYEISELLALAGENRFRINAYERASQTVESLTSDTEELKDKGKLQEIPGIGEGIAEKITEFLETGKLKYLEALKKKFPEGLLEIMAVPGIGPKKAKELFEKLKITNVQELREAASSGRLRDLPGFGEKTEQNILSGIELKEKSKGRILLSDALSAAKELVSQLKKNKEIIEIEPAGSLRRRKETIGDIDILCTVKKGEEKKIIEKFINLNGVQKVTAAGGTKASIIAEGGIQVDLRVIEQRSYGAALQYFTGSKEHNIVLREFANKKGLTINEYGVYRLTPRQRRGSVTVTEIGNCHALQTSNKTKSIAGETEKEVYETVGMEYIEPEMRENRGEIEAALKGELPKLVELKDILGDTHVHSYFSDGTQPILEIAEYAAEFGYQWIVITDHSQSLKVAHGMAPKDLRKKLDEVRNANQKQDKIKVLYGTEVDILMDGSLDYSDDILKGFDYVMASIHSGFKQPEEKIHSRIFKAFQNKYVHCLSHPTGRLIGAREPYAVNMEKVIEEAKKTGVYLEINAYPERLDIYDVHCLKAKEARVKVTIGTDAHHMEQLSYMELGVCVARRGWLEKNDVINSMPYDKLMKALNSRR